MCVRRCTHMAVDIFNSISSWISAIGSHFRNNVLRSAIPSYSELDISSVCAKSQLNRRKQFCRYFLREKNTNTHSFTIKAATRNSKWIPTWMSLSIQTKKEGKKSNYGQTNYNVSTNEGKRLKLLNENIHFRASGASTTIADNSRNSTTKTQMCEYRMFTWKDYGYVLTFARANT